MNEEKGYSCLSEGLLAECKPMLEEFINTYYPKNYDNNLVDLLDISNRNKILNKLYKWKI